MAHCPPRPTPAAAAPKGGGYEELEEATCGRRPKGEEDARANAPLRRPKQGGGGGAVISGEGQVAAL